MDADRAQDIVALRKESVDRNPVLGWRLTACLTSLSARRAWIEIFFLDDVLLDYKEVALRKESVDRNHTVQIVIVIVYGRSPQGERG